MMDFARRLAPPRDADATRAVAVLPSRYGGGSPLRSSPATMHGDGEGPPGLLVGAMEPMQVAASRLDPARTPAAEARGQRLSAIPSSAPSGEAAPRDAAMPMSRSLGDTGDVHPADRRPLHLPSRDTQAPVPLGGVAAAIVTPELAQVQNALPPRFAGLRPISARPAAMQHAPTRRPLSEAALAARSARTSEPRPIVQVTIDRIDVRAPATPPRAMAPQKRIATPSVSLSDYLRARGAAPSGGAT